jgi:hypothetical protein
MIKELVAGGIVTLVIGGATYTVSQKDVADNFADDTGLSQQEAEQYVSNVKQEDLLDYDEVGDSYITDGNMIISSANEIDCVNYDYEWQSASLTCTQGKAQLMQLGNDEISLGKSYIKLGTDSANEADINVTIGLLTDVNAGYDNTIITYLLYPSDIDEAKKANSYNKALLEAALESE